MVGLVRPMNQYQIIFSQKIQRKESDDMTGRKNQQPLQLEISKSIFNDAFFPLLFDYTHRWETYKGSAGS